MLNFEIERKILSKLLKSPKGLTRLQLQRAALNGYVRFDYDPVLAKLRNDGIITYTNDIYKVSEHYRVSLYVKANSRRV